MLLEYWAYVGYAPKIMRGDGSLSLKQAKFIPETRYTYCLEEIVVPSSRHGIFPKQGGPKMDPKTLDSLSQVPSNRCPISEKPPRSCCGGCRGQSYGRHRNHCSSSVSCGIEIVDDCAKKMRK